MVTYITFVTKQRKIWYGFYPTKEKIYTSIACMLVCFFSISAYHYPNFKQARSTVYFRIFNGHASSNQPQTNKNMFIMLKESVEKNLFGLFMPWNDSCLTLLASATSFWQTNQGQSFRNLYWFHRLHFKPLWL